MRIALLVEGDVNDACMVVGLREARSRFLDGAVPLQLVVRDHALSVAGAGVAPVGERKRHDLRAVYRVAVGLAQALAGVQGDEQRVDVDWRVMSVGLQLWVDEIRTACDDVPC